MRSKAKTRSVLQSPFGFDRQDGRQMECEYFHSFRYFEPEIQSGRITHDDRPDFLVEIGDRIVGVELTRLFRPEGGQQIESTQDLITKEPRRKANEHRLPAAHITLFFNLRRAFDSTTRERIADAVVSLVAEQMPADGASVQLEGAPGQPCEVDLILINRTHRHALGCWAWFEFGTVNEKDAARVIQEAIAKKAESQSAYLERCTECWLLLVADSFRTSCKFALETVCQSHEFTSPFTRAYVLDFGKGRLYRPHCSRLSEAN
jgi:hypothetical protein